MKLNKLVLSMLLAGASASHAATEQTVSAQAITAQTLSAMRAVQVLEAGLVAQNLINWQVGEFHRANVKMALPLPGKSYKYVDREETARNAFWYINEIELLGQKQKSETLMDRSNGQVLEQIVNGEKQPVNNDQTMEIIEQYETDITVPAGKFDCMYIKAKVTADGKTQELEAWINPIDVNLDGMLKVKIASQMGSIEILLKEFGKNP